MKQNIPFKKDVLFKTKVAEIEAINLSENINNRNPGVISGEFKIAGTYKMHMASRLSEEFEFNIPFDIALEDRHDPETINLNVTNFRYEIIDNEILRAFIDVELDGLVEDHHELINEFHEDIRVEEPIPEFEPTNVVENEVNINEININIETNEVEEEQNITNEVNTIFNNLNDTEETYSTYNVYTMKDEDSLEQVITKYQTDIDTLARYNQVEQVKAGDKLIFPLNKNQDE